MKLKRSKKDYGSGCGITIFDSDLFSVGIMKHHIGIKTTLEILDCNKTIQFDGKHDIKSDKACFEQLTFTEIKTLIKAREKKAFEEGRKDKSFEIRECFNIQ